MTGMIRFFGTGSKSVTTLNHGWFQIQKESIKWCIATPSEKHIRYHYLFSFSCFSFWGLLQIIQIIPIISQHCCWFTWMFFFMVHNPEISQYYYPMLQKTAITIVIPWSSHDYPIIISFVFHGYPIIQFYTIIIQLYHYYYPIIGWLYHYYPIFMAS